MISPSSFKDLVAQMSPKEAAKKLKTLRECFENNPVGSWSEALGFDAHWMDYPNYEFYLRKRAGNGDVF